MRTFALTLLFLTIPLFAVQAQDDATPSIQVEVVLTRQIEDRQPIDAAELFPKDVGQVVAWTRVTGAAQSTIEHVWRYKEHEFVVPLNIGGSPWRTWSIKKIPAAWSGDWIFEVRDAAGTVISSNAFRVGAEVEADVEQNDDSQ